MCIHLSLSIYIYYSDFPPFFSFIARGACIRSPRGICVVTFLCFMLS